MESITVRWDGPITVEEAIEAPDENMTAAEFAAAFAATHALHKQDWEVGHGTWGFVLDGEYVPDDAPIELLAGESVHLTLLVPMADNAPPDPDEVVALDPAVVKAERAKAARAARKATRDAERDAQDAGSS